MSPQPSTQPPQRYVRPRRAGILIVSAAALLTVASLVTVHVADAATGDTTQTVQAEAYAAQSGAQVEGTADTGGGQNVGYLASGDWLRYDGVNLGSGGAVSIAARIASAGTGGDGTIELHTGSQTGALLAQIAVTSTGGWQTWATRTVTATPTATGSQSVFAVLRAASTRDFVNINWFSFTIGGTAGSPSPTGMPSMSMPGSSAPGTWVDIDQAAWNAQLAAFRALPMDPAPANSVRVSEFNAACPYSHSFKDDPIVFPGQPGASHMHSFFGNTSTERGDHHGVPARHPHVELWPGRGPVRVLDPDPLRARRRR